jgi:hypothetical protein
MQIYFFFNSSIVKFVEVVFPLSHEIIASGGKHETIRKQDNSYITNKYGGGAFSNSPE